MPAFIAELRAQEGVPARALEFAILTAARISEAVNATWDEIDLDKPVWTIPADRIKMGREHRVPLSGPALSLLDAMTKIRRGNYVFPGYV
jgi:integrase